MDLRLRILRSAMNVDDSRRIINRLLSALSELLSMKSISGILHNCETLGEYAVFYRIHTSCYSHSLETVTTCFILC